MENKDKIMVFNYRALLIDKSGRFEYVILTFDKALSAVSLSKIFEDMQLANPSLDDIIIASATVSQMDRDPEKEDVFTVIDMLASCLTGTFTEKESKDLLDTAIQEIKKTIDNNNGGNYAN